MTEAGSDERLAPLVEGDPQRLGDITLIGRLESGDSGIVYAGLLGRQQVAVVLLTEGAELDSYARARFTDAVHDTLVDGPMSPETDSPVAERRLVAGEDSPEIAPWVAVPADSWDDGAKLAGALLAPVALEHLTPSAPVRGPDFRPHWTDRPGPGRWRVWPLPWPGALSAAGRWTYLASFTLVLAIASIALFIAVKLFEHQPPAPVNPPFPVPRTPSPPTQSPTTTPTPSTTPPPATGPTKTYSTATGNPPIV